MDFAEGLFAILCDIRHVLFIKMTKFGQISPAADNRERDCPSKTP